MILLGLALCFGDVGGIAALLGLTLCFGGVGGIAIFGVTIGNGGMIGTETLALDFEGSTVLTVGFDFLPTASASVGDRLGALTFLRVLAGAVIFLTASHCPHSHPLQTVEANAATSAPPPFAIWS